MCSMTAHESLADTPVFCADCYKHSLMTPLVAGPRVLVYDNACNVHRFNMRREPKFFAHTWHAIDRTHLKGHTT